ncbi:hypothetical protein QUT13_22535, partial [Xanthomonas citri pv. citri]
MLIKNDAHKILGDDTALLSFMPKIKKWVVEDWLPRAKRAGLKAAASSVSIMFSASSRLRVYRAESSRKADYRNLSCLSWVSSCGIPSGAIEPTIEE